MLKLAVLVATAGLFQAESLDPYFKFKPETVWVYARTQTTAEGEKKSEFTVKVLKEADGKVTVEQKEPEENGKVLKVLYRWYAKDGFFVVAMVASVGEEMIYRLYKAGSKKGDTWECKTLPGLVKTTVTHRGTAEVKTPAGTYKDAVCVRLEGEARGTKILQDFYLVPNVGVVKWEDFNEKALEELKEFREKK